jgi:cysteinyl-tRNA synthetase
LWVCPDIVYLSASFKLNTVFKKSNNMNLFTISTAIFCCLLLSCQHNTAQETDKIIDYRKEMRDFVIEISETAKAKNPNFTVIPQNGVELLLEEYDAQEVLK